jgi:hypothetical protein
LLLENKRDILRGADLGSKLIMQRGLITLESLLLFAYLISKSDEGTSRTTLQEVEQLFLEVDGFRGRMDAINIERRFHQIPYNINLLFVFFEHMMIFAFFLKLRNNQVYLCG